MAQPMIHDDLDDCELAYLCSWSRFTRQCVDGAGFAATIEIWSDAFDTIIGDVPPDSVHPDCWHRVRQHALS